MKMKKKRICYVCGAKLTVRKENVYKVWEYQSALTGLTEPSRVYDVMDCPQCGCQQMLATRMPSLEFMTERKEQ